MTDWREHVLNDPGVAAELVRADPFSMAVRKLRGASQLGSNGVLYLAHIARPVDARRLWPHETRVWDAPLVAPTLF